jgi:hypothetical protein
LDEELREEFAWVDGEAFSFGVEELVSVGVEVEMDLGGRAFFASHSD